MSHKIILQWFVKSVLLTLTFELLFWYRHSLLHNAWIRFDQQLLEKTDMNSTQSNKTAGFRFSIKYLKSKIVLKIVCLVTVLLAPKLIFYASKSELLFTNLKTLHLARVVMMQFLEK